ncbi:MAG TPA: MarR family transcriptional regulator [Acidobacteriaceae bacterium]
MTDRADYSRLSGGAALGARLRRLSERIDRDSTRVYAARGLQFEQRWFGIMNQIAIHGPMTVGEIAAALRITHVSVSQARRSLEEAGLATSLHDESDARRRPIALTRRGKVLIVELMPLWEAFNDTAAELNEESGNVVALLDRLEEALDTRSLFDRITERINRRTDL